VKQTTALKVLSGNDIAVASPSMTVTFGGADDRSRATSTGSSSSAVSDGTRPASTIVVTPGPGPSSSTDGPRSTSDSTQGSRRCSTARVQRPDRQYHMWKRFTEVTVRYGTAAHHRTGQPRMAERT